MGTTMSEAEAPPVRRRGFLVVVWIQAWYSAGSRCLSCAALRRQNARDDHPRRNRRLGVERRRPSQRRPAIGIDAGSSGRAGGAHRGAAGRVIAHRPRGALRVDLRTSASAFHQNRAGRAGGLDDAVALSAKRPVLPMAGSCGKRRGEQDSCEEDAGPWEARAAHLPTRRAWGHGLLQTDQLRDAEAPLGRHADIGALRRKSRFGSAIQPGPGEDFPIAAGNAGSRKPCRPYSRSEDAGRALRAGRRPAPPDRRRDGRNSGRGLRRQSCLAVRALWRGAP